MMMVMMMMMMMMMMMDNNDDDDAGELILSEAPLFTVPSEAHNADIDQYLETTLQVGTGILIMMKVMMMVMIVTMLLIMMSIKESEIRGA